ncbi:hypothetical protein CPB83DRAFT_909427 [Crepidotus variabilis]|uniref:F-box domain-containing protein n=1 Tax=Crepidotus variabilis TaxID=179855 RepID=A0A9P6E9D6_9AGAR|nr:hypothetical protein CPB83DRAFT_909427 [Crepidotus variabilis]
MERQARFSRLKAKAASSNQGQDDPDFKEDSTDESMDVDNEPLMTTTQPSKGRGKKRKVGASWAVQPASKKVRGKRRILKDLVEMPLDDCLIQLDPSNLLHLSRTTKAIRNILMSKASVSVWKSSFENVEPPLPQCPEDMSEPAYADLVFGKGCYYCGRQTSSVRIAWQCRIRTCNKCTESHFAEKRSYFHRNYSSELAHQLPSLTLSVTPGRYERLIVYCWVDRDDQWKRQYENLKDAEKQSQWKTEKMKAATAVRQHSALCDAWSKEKEEIFRQNQQIVVENRRATVVDHLRKMGWSEELDKIPNEDPKPQDQNSVTKACQKPLTERGLKSLEPALTAFMDKRRKARIEQEREAFLNKRLVPLQDAYATHLLTLPAAFGHPNIADIFSLPLIRDIVNDDATPEFSVSHFERLRAAFPRVQTLWKAFAREQLLNLVFETVESSSDENRPQVSLDPENFLDKPSAFFSCLSCNLSVHARDLLRHQCLRESYSWGALDVDERFLRQTLGAIRWNVQGPRGIKFDGVLSNRVDNILQNLGYNPSVLSADDLDKADPKIECILCNSEGSGRYTMRWLALATHLSEDRLNRHVPKHLRIIEASEASVVRGRIDEHIAISFTDKQAMCTVCQEKNIYTSLLNHTREVHGTVRPKIGEDIISTNETILPASFNKYKHCHRLWPPLSQEDVDGLITD